MNITTCVICDERKAWQFHRCGQNVRSPLCVSRAVGELEKKLGVKLAKSIGKVVKPTPCGKVLCHMAIEALDEAEDLGSPAKALASGKENRYPLIISTLAKILPCARIRLS